MWDKSVFDRLRKEKIHAMTGGGKTKIQKQHEAGKLTARERIDTLFDSGTFVEIGELVTSRCIDFGMEKKKVPGDGVIIGYGKINGRLACVSAEDFTVIGGTLGEAHAKKICAIQDMALKMRVPIIMINDSGGARIEEGVDSLNGYAGIFYRNTKASGVIPQIAVIMGPCAGGACYSPAICDFVFMVWNTSYMFITGPKVVKSVIGEDVSAPQLGGTDIHMTKSGAAHFAYSDDKECLKAVRKLLCYLPQNAAEMPQVQPDCSIDDSSKLEEIVPQNPRKPYDVKNVIRIIADQESFFEVHELWARNAVVGLGRVDGNTVGFVANQPAFMGGALDYDSSDKIARFVRTCDCFHIPLIVLVDVPAFLPGTKQESGGIIRHGAKMLYAFSEATVPKISLIMRKAYGGAYIAMNSKEMGADIVFAWPIAEIAVMGAEGAIEIVHRKELRENLPCREELLERYREQFLNPYLAAARGYIDAVIEPLETRRQIAAALEALSRKQEETMGKQHGNIPL